METIISKADGVFLWVRLVVEQMLRGFRDGETIRTLKRKVDSLPPDLDGFFQRIIDSIEPAYRREGSAYLQTALFSIQDEQTAWPHGLLEYTFLEHEEPGFALNSDYDFEELVLDNLNALEYRIDLGKRRLNGRCMGLLEWAPSSVYAPNISSFDYRQNREYPMMKLLGINVNLLHRSLMDYLMRAEAQVILRQHTGGPFESRQFLCNALLVNICALTNYASRLATYTLHSGNSSIDLLVDQTQCLLKGVAGLQDQSSATSWTLLHRLEPTLQLLKSVTTVTTETSEPRWGYEVPRIHGFLRGIKTSRPLSLAVAVQYRMEDVLKHHLPTMSLREVQKAELLDISLRQSFNGSNPQAAIIQCVLENGADPNMLYPNLADRNSLTIWQRYLDRATSPFQAREINIMALMIRHGAETQFPKGMFDINPVIEDNMLPQTDQHVRKPTTLLQMLKNLEKRLSGPLPVIFHPYPDFPTMLEALRSLQTLVCEVEAAKKSHAADQPTQSKKKKRKQNEAATTIKDNERQKSLRSSRSGDRKRSPRT